MPSFGRVRGLGSRRQQRPKIIHGGNKRRQLAFARRRDGSAESPSAHGGGARAAELLASARLPVPEPEAFCGRHVGIEREDRLVTDVPLWGWQGAELKKGWGGGLHCCMAVIVW